MVSHCQYRTVDTEDIAIIQTMPISIYILQKRDNAATTAVLSLLILSLLNIIIQK